MTKKTTQHKLDEKKFLVDLAKLIAFQTVTGQPEGFLEAMKFIQEQIDPKAHITFLDNGGEPILLASNVVTKTPDVCYLVHLDVMSGKPEQFVMRIDNGNAYGRGVSDMKFSIPIGISILNYLIAINSKLSFMLAITSDEERGGFNGAGFLAGKFMLVPKLVIAPDGGDNFVLKNKSKGVCHIKISREGTTAHSSRPWLGDNALTPIILVAEMLINHYKQANAKEGWVTTMNLGYLHAGAEINKVAERAELGIDFRFPPEDDSVADITKLVKAFCTKVDPKLKVELVAEGVAAFVDPKHPVIQLFLDTVVKHTRKIAQIDGAHGANDARHFSKRGIPFIMTKPKGGDIHGDNEHINIDSTMLFYDIFIDFLAKYEKKL